MRFIILPISKTRLNLILSGQKTLELRKKCIQEDVQHIFFYEKKSNLIKGEASIEKRILTSPRSKLSTEDLKAAHMTEGEYETYIKNGEAFAYYLKDIRSIELPLKEVELSRPPKYPIYRDLAGNTAG